MQRIGVFVCWCGSNIAATVDVHAVAEALARSPASSPAYYQYMCSQAGQNLIKDAIRDHGLTGVVICSCSPGCTSRPSARPRPARAEPLHGRDR